MEGRLTDSFFASYTHNEREEQYSEESENDIDEYIEDNNDDISEYYREILDPINNRINKLINKIQNNHRYRMTSLKKEYDELKIMIEGKYQRYNLISNVHNHIIDLDYKLENAYRTIEHYFI